MKLSQIAKLDSWLELTKETARRDIETARERVFKYLEKNGPDNDRHMAAMLGWDINSLVPRRYELVQEGKVIEVGTTYDEGTRRTVTLWAINNGRCENATTDSRERSGAPVH